MSPVREQLRDWLFPPDNGFWLTLLRTGLGLQVILYTWSFRNDWSYFFPGSRSQVSQSGLGEIILSSETSWTPRIGWLVTAGDWAHLNQQVVLWGIWLLLLLSGCCLLAGFFSRSAAVMAWFLYLCSVKSGGLLAYGVDTFTTIGLFYLMIAPLPDRFAVDSILWKPRLRDPERLGFHRRVLQLHLCLIYFFGGISKSIGIDWWNGNSIWRALTRPPFNLIAPELLARSVPLLAALGIAVCLLETGYPIFIWIRRTRVPWLLGVLVMHLSIGLAMGLYLFALIMIVLNLAAFAPVRRLPMKNEFLQNA